ncbi:MAG: 3'(2'),5'-bisphosphate nucleotidase [Marinilabiliales bacterium]|nr:MAG: 3'(2'),5'-bisphosphate nucleotidase [Marinilabiliales bacterium]
MDNYKEILISLARKAGEEILNFYGKNYTTNFKIDDSPVTDADLAANKIIVEGLSNTDIPIISEESANMSYSERKDLKEYWLVDPLDGTKQFVRNEDEFTVNIARILDNSPVEGVVYAPAHKKLYYGNLKDGAHLYNYKASVEIVSKLPLANQEGLSLIISKSHLNDATREFVEKVRSKYSNIEICRVGSSLKFCCLAEGHSDIYPRIGSISEWDIASGHAVLKSAGGKVINIATGEEIIYNTKDMKTPDFIAFLDESKYNLLFE